VQQAINGARPHTNVPQLKGYPIVGNLPQYWHNLLSTLVDAQRNGGDLVRINYGPVGFYLLSHPDHVEWVLKKNPKNYVKSHNRAKLQALVGGGLGNYEGASWLRQRRLMQPAFHRRRLEGFARIMVEETHKMLDRWEVAAAEGRLLDVARQMKLLTRRIIVRALLGTEEGKEDQGEKVGWAFDAVFSGIGLQYVMPLWFGRLPIPSNRRFERALTVLDDEIYRLIHRKRNGHEGEGDDLLSMLMEARDKETGESMTEKQLRDEVLSLYLAGSETTANALSWVWYLLSKYPEARRKVHQESSRAFVGRPPGSEVLPKLVYTRMVIDETLRLYPPVWRIVRDAVEDDVIGGYRFPAGSIFMLSSYVTHRRADLWENPEGFDPERFAPENGAGRPRCAYYPFGAGHRQCIGNNFALMEATLVVASVAQHYRLDLVPGQEVKARAKEALGPHPGVWVMVHSSAGADDG
jgi:cytochrome P450